MESGLIIEKLHTWRYLPKMSGAELKKLTLRDGVVRSAIEKYTERYTPENVSSDGTDPAVDKLIDSRFCDVPDFPPNGTLSAGNGPQEANWPTSCRGRLRFGLTFGNLPGMTKEQTRLAFICAMNTMNLPTDAFIAPTDDWSRRGANIWAGVGRLSGSTLAWSYLAQNRCDAILEQRYNSGRSWGNFWYTVTVAAHELLHAWGHQHLNTRGALMRPEINTESVGRKGWMSAADFAQARRLGYQVGDTTRPSDEIVMRIPGSEPPKPDPDPEPDPPKPQPPKPQPPTDPNDPFIGVWTAPNGKRYVMSPFPEF